MKLEDETTPGLRVEALSRGRGVPAQTRQAYLRIKALLLEARNQGMSLTIREQTIGLEGETRLCVEFDKRKDAITLLNKIEPIAKGMDLLSLEAKRCQAQ